MKTCKPNLFAAYAQKNAVHTLKNICNDLSPLCEEIVWRSARISLTPCEDIVNTLRGYRQHPVRISSFSGKHTHACSGIMVKDTTFYHFFTLQHQEINVYQLPVINYFVTLQSDCHMAYTPPRHIHKSYINYFHETINTKGNARLLACRDGET